MSRSDAESGDGPSEPIDSRLEQREQFAAALNAQGYTDVLVVRREVARDIATDARLAIIDTLSSDESIDSIRNLARTLDRDKGAVSKDCQRLAHFDIITYEGDGDGTPKRPVLNHEHVVFEPVV